MYKKILIIISKYISIKLKKYYFLLTKFLIKVLNYRKNFYILFKCDLIIYNFLIIFLLF